MGSLTLPTDRSRFRRKNFVLLAKAMYASECALDCDHTEIDRYMNPDFANQSSAAHPHSVAPSPGSDFSDNNRVAMRARYSLYCSPELQYIVAARG